MAAVDETALHEAVRERVGERGRGGGGGGGKGHQAHDAGLREHGGARRQCRRAGSRLLDAARPVVASRAGPLRLGSWTLIWRLVRLRRCPRRWHASLARRWAGSPRPLSKAPQSLKSLSVGTPLESVGLTPARVGWPMRIRHAARPCAGSCAISSSRRATWHWRYSLRWDWPRDAYLGGHAQAGDFLLSPPPRAIGTVAQPPPRLDRRVARRGGAVGGGPVPPRWGVSLAPCVGARRRRTATCGNRRPFTRGLWEPIEPLPGARHGVYRLVFVRNGFHAFH